MESRTPGVLCLCLCDFQNSLSALLPINNCECCRHGARCGRDNGATGGQHASCCSALLILFSCYENNTPLRWGGKECWMGGEGRKDYLGTLPPTNQTHSSHGCQPPELCRCSDLCPVEPAGCHAGHIWQPLGKASCWPSVKWQLLELTAGGSTWGEKSWSWEFT